MAPLQLAALLCLINLSFSFAPQPLILNQSLQHSRVFRPPSCLAAKPKANWEPFVGDLFRSNKDKKNGMALGVQMAQLLLDKRRQAALKKDLKTRFPLVPASVLEGTIDMVAESFVNVAPSELRQALQPGGMAKMRPALQKKMVQSLVTQTWIRDLPLLGLADKQKLCETVVDLALEYVLQDAQELLAAPEVRLEALQIQKQDIYKQMGWKKVILYRIGHNPGKIFLTVVVSALFFYQQRRVPVVMAVVSGIQTVSASLISFWNAAHVKLAAWTGFKWKWNKAGVKKTLMKQRRR
jgi:hypothetical protein